MDELFSSTTTFSAVKAIHNRISQEEESIRRAIEYCARKTQSANPSAPLVPEQILNLLYFIAIGFDKHYPDSAVLPLCMYFEEQLDDDGKEKFRTVLVESLNAANDDHDRKTIFGKIVALLQSFIMTRVANVDGKGSSIFALDDGITTAVPLLDLLNDINNEQNYIPYEEFYNDAIKDAVSMKEEYPRWKQSPGFSIFNYPFLLDSQAKGELLKVENMITMRHELQDSFFRAMFIGVNSPYLHLEVRRENVVRDAIAQLATKTTHDLKKQLRVTFVGEEGIDDGGIQKEFFQIIVKEIFGSGHGMFESNPESRLCWFTKEHATDHGVLEEYMLIGRLVGLAVYNSNTLEIPFPTALFKKILQCPVTIDDLIELDPSMGRGLKSLLDHPDTPEFGVVFGDWTFKIREINLSYHNKSEFVDLYVDFVFNSSVASSFQHFLDGVYSVIDRDALAGFRPTEFQQLVIGCPTLDFKALEKNTKYEGWSDDCELIKQFWEIVHGMTLEEQKMLLFFTTGSDRAPVGGLGNLTFVVARNGPDR
ncbi:putative E3 ubiquitin-protein ligase HTD2 [Entophlyctis luteolus]|nr:putative E3 ubiquitin-protein ligase HTD2 [Entophlyctis luteolus]